uniref:BOS complex subunit TMEM147 n=1 Tax=Xiphophorus maculatus TaxID=8083 RepID=A0A3B5Q2A3_XIPMA
MTHFHFGNCFALAYFLYFITYSTNAAMLFLATFFPTWEGGAGVSDFAREFMKATVDLGEYKIMVAAMGWATAELVTSRFLPLWVGARGIGFDWKYIQMSFDSNISLLSFTRYDLPKTFRLPVAMLAVLLCILSFSLSFFPHKLTLTIWRSLQISATFMLLCCHHLVK